MEWRLQPHGIEAAATWNGGCNHMGSRLQPHGMEAVTTWDRGCNRVRVDGVDAVDGHALAVVALEVGGQYLVEVSPLLGDEQ